jgi:hypothetical protein
MNKRLGRDVLLNSKPRIMNLRITLFGLFLALTANLFAKVYIDERALGTSLGGWSKRGGGAAEYPLSGANYRTYRPEITPTPDGGLFISVRIDHVRGWLSSDDHAMLEISVDRKGTVVSAQSSIAIQGRSVTSDVIRGGTDAGNKLGGVDRAVQIGTDLIADISGKMLREKIVEAGRVSFPSALRHNYNLLFQAIRTEEEPKQALIVEIDEAVAPEASAPPETKKLEIRPYATGTHPELPVGKKD